MEHADDHRRARRSRKLPLECSPEELFPAFASRPGAVFLDSATAGDPATERFSILSCDPVETIEDALPDHVFAPARAPEPRDHDFTASCGSAGAPPFRAGWIGFLSYESASLWNSDLATFPPEPGLPRAWWGRYEASLACRRSDGEWFLSRSDSEAGKRAEERLIALVAEPRPGGLPSSGSGSSGEQPIARHPAGTPPNTTHPVATQPNREFRQAANPEWILQRPEHARNVGEILRWIERGHIYQANLTYRVSCSFEGSPVSLYQALRRCNPAHYCAYLSTSAVEPSMGRPLTILSSSPELFLRVRGREVETRPIKGTRPRGVDPERDRILAEELLASVKDRAELTMIVDLERNDLGRVCVPGSMRVGPFPRVESYQTVHHLVADVSGTLREKTTLLELIAATFPGGSVTGAPKIRAMEILRDLERTPRFVYTGALGYLDHGGDLELALTIRTLWIDGPRVHFGVGGGIVADSTADGEWQETLHKAQGMMAALTTVTE